jgi:alpha/beta superfamily hydrolase
LSHPHPLYGGDMSNPLIEHLFVALPKRGLAVLRYNFRGVGASTGSFDKGVGERDDAEAAFAAASELIGEGAVLSAGWSFGAVVSMSADHKSLVGWVAIAAPLNMIDASSLPASADERPTVLLVPEFDQFTLPAAAAEATAQWVNTSVVTLRGADHSVGSGADAAVETITALAAS